MFLFSGCKSGMIDRENDGYSRNTGGSCTTECICAGGGVEAAAQRHAHHVLRIRAERTISFLCGDSSEGAHLWVSTCPGTFLRSPTQKLIYRTRTKYWSYVFQFSRLLGALLGAGSTRSILSVDQIRSYNLLHTNANILLYMYRTSFHILVLCA